MLSTKITTKKKHIKTYLFTNHRGNDNLYLPNSQPLLYLTVFHFEFRYPIVKMIVRFVCVFNIFKLIVELFNNWRKFCGHLGFRTRKNQLPLWIERDIRFILVFHDTKTSETFCFGKNSHDTTGYDPTRKKSTKLMKRILWVM